ncbi:dipeptidase [Streptomyces prunicolor]|uniref:Membrane dipeptidase n=1 Tax=Streptomyces prunicolor TaxID=67348 RepID=A0ABU4FC04_9ACTN|nr:membrane dipeptidase [Streptomyces prunicolor]MCX5239177.1 dipeptidase [Streptomyces prunicolor]MDV7218101.1 membrane dipeptidase [Streptomyces prunicolor]
MSNETVETRRPPLLWEQHCCLALEKHADVGELARYRRPGGSFVSVNVGYAPHGTDDVTGLLASWRKRIAADDRLRLVASVDDIDAAARAGEVAVAFDLEDSGPLEGELDRVRLFHDLGVRTMLPSYNTRNAAGGGCLDEVDEGLTAYGRALVRELNAVGMVADGSHCGTRTGLDLCEVSQLPVVYSHSCMRAVWDHPRNITDDQAKECAATGGVVGITGVGIFLGPNDASVEALVRHIDHAVDLVGPEHVGVSTDYPFDEGDFNAMLEQSPELYPDCYTRWGPIDFMPPEGLLTVEGALRARGYPEDAVAAILGGNFRRVAAQVWQQGASATAVGTGPSR